MQWRSATKCLKGGDVRSMLQEHRCYLAPALRGDEVKRGALLCIPDINITARGQYVSGDDRRVLLTVCANSHVKSGILVEVFLVEQA
jgi:hypothetical protein